MEGDAQRSSHTPDRRYFNPLPPHGGRLITSLLYYYYTQFQSTPSAWRETPVWKHVQQSKTSFQSTPSAWRETAQSARYLCFFGISIHSLRMEGDMIHLVQLSIFFISIHSLRMEGDVFSCVHAFTSRFISIHSLRMEGDCGVIRWGYRKNISIHSLRMEGDYMKSAGIAYRVLISIHSLRMEGDIDTQIKVFDDARISIHSLRMEGDRYKYPKYTVFAIFQSTPSAWRETPACDDLYNIFIFQSTPSAWRETVVSHVICITSKFQSTPSAWRETCVQPSVSLLDSYFNPLPPHGGRLPQHPPTPVGSVFQSTPSAWRETHTNLHRKNPSPISIHSLRMEGDSVLG